MIFTMLLPPRYDERKWTLARQIGVRNVITKAHPDLSKLSPPFEFNSLKTVHENFRKEGLHLYGLEGDQFDMSPIKLGLPNRDELIEKYQQMLRNMGRLDIRLLCYNFMAVIGWYRTKIDVQERGEALVSEYNQKDEGELVEEHLRISEGQLWDNLYYFLEAVLPVAEENGIEMALHPDDPPISPLKGIGRILTSAASFDKIKKDFPSPANGITFCQATFKAMGEDLKAISRPWFEDNRIFFLHLRDIIGKKENFRESFHDNGSTDMAKLLKHYVECGFNGPLRPDHAPTMYGDVQKDFSGGTSVGYEVTGKIWGLGYLKGICEAYGISVR